MGNKASATWNVLSTQEGHITDLIQGRKNKSEEKDIQLWDPATMPQHPFTGYVPRALMDEDNIYIEALTAVEASWFSINLICDNPSDDPNDDLNDDPNDYQNDYPNNVPKNIAYHYRVDFGTGQVVTRTRINGEWTEEIRHDSDFKHFLRGSKFELVIRILEEEIKTEVNTVTLSSVPLYHPIGTVKYIQVLGDIDKVFTLKFEFA